ASGAGCSAATEPRSRYWISSGPCGPPGNSRSPGWNSSPLGPRRCHSGLLRPPFFAGGRAAPVLTAAPAAPEPGRAGAAGAAPATGAVLGAPLADGAGTGLGGAGRAGFGAGRSGAFGFSFALGLARAAGALARAGRFVFLRAAVGIVSPRAGTSR